MNFSHHDIILQYLLLALLLPSTAIELQAQETPSTPDVDNAIVRFAGATGVEVGWQSLDVNRDGWALNQVTVPGQYSFPSGHTYRLRVDLPKETSATMYTLLHIFPDAGKRTVGKPIVFEVNRLLTHALQNGEFRQIIYLDQTAEPPSQEFMLADYSHTVSYETATKRIEKKGPILAVISVGRYNQHHLKPIPSAENRLPRALGMHTWGIQSDQTIDPTTVGFPANEAIIPGVVVNPHGPFATPVEPDSTISPRQLPRSNVIVIQTTPDIERSEVIRSVVEALEKDGSAKRGEIDRIGKPVAFEATISTQRDWSQGKVVKLIETLRSLGVQRMALRVASGSADQESSVIVQCPPDVTWRRVHTITEELENLGDLKVDVRVAANNDPVTPVAAGQATQPPTSLSSIIPYFPPAPTAALSHVETSHVKMFQLKHASAKTAARIIEQLYDAEHSIAVDERTNSLIFNGSKQAADKIEAVLIKIDEPTPKESMGDESRSKVDSTGPLQPAPNGFDGEPVDLRGVTFRDVGSVEPLAFDFSMGVTLDGESTAQLRKLYNELDLKAQELAEKLNSPLPDPASGERLKDDLQQTVERAFVVRQKLQHAELAEFAQRLKEIEQSIEMRDKVSQQIIDRRIEELLDPNLGWDATDSNRGPVPDHRSTPDQTKRY